jgi:ribosomal protein S27AE
MSNDWWSRKLSNGPQQPNRPPTAPPSQIPYRPYPTTSSPQVSYDPESDQTTVSRARSAKLSDRCPECNSGNYFAPQGTQRMRCYDCGYPVLQSGSGGGLPSDSSGPATPARQVASSGFNPKVIVDRIG